MSEAIAIVGESGSGKSRSIKNLDPDTTFVINLVNKRLPFRGSIRKYIKKKSPDGRNQNYLETRNANKILKALKQINEKATYIKVVVIDDFLAVFERLVSDTGAFVFFRIHQGHV